MFTNTFPNMSRFRARIPLAMAAALAAAILAPAAHAAVPADCAPDAWEPDGDWDFHSAAGATYEELVGLFDREVANSRAITAGCDDLDTLAPTAGHHGPFHLRWILVHMIEEYARHCGHADLIRESIDGATGD